MKKILIVNANYYKIISNNLISNAKKRLIIKKYSISKIDVPGVFEIPFVIRNSLSKNRFNCSPGYQLRDFTYIQDVILAIFKTLKSKKSNGEIINIGFGKPTKIRDLIIMIVKLIGSGKPIFSQIELRQDEIVKLYPSVLKAKRILNWVPRTSLKKGLEKTIKFYKNKWKKLV